MIIERPIYSDALMRSAGNGLIKIVTGMRRAGKSFLLKKLFARQLLAAGVSESHIIVVDMESRHNLPLKDPDALLSHIEGAMTDRRSPYFIMIDEVQEVCDFVSVLSTLAVTDGVDVYVTGSNSRFLSTDIATQFRGRAYSCFILSARSSPCFVGSFLWLLLLYRLAIFYDVFLKVGIR